MAQKAPEKHHREGISPIELFEMLPDEQTARQWFEAQIWPEERRCGHCASTRTRRVPNEKPMPYWCSDCRRYFSLRTGTAIERSKIPLRKWAIGIYLCLTSLKPVSSMKLHRDLKIGQKAAWFMLHRLRKAWVPIQDDDEYTGPVEANEAYFGGKRRNMPKKKHARLTGPGALGKTAVAGMKDRPNNRVSTKVVPNTKSKRMSPFHNGACQAGSADLHGRCPHLPLSPEPRNSEAFLGQVCQRSSPN